MNKKREKIFALKPLLEKELQKAKLRYEKVRESAAEIARSAYNSPSQSGDRFHSQGQSDIAEEDVKRFERVLEEIEKETEKDKPDKTTAFCWVELEYDNGERDNFYIVNDPLSIPGYKFVSSKSPFGKVLIDKKVGDSLIFETNELKKTGKIVMIG